MTRGRKKGVPVPHYKEMYLKMKDERDDLGKQLGKLAAEAVQRGIELHKMESQLTSLGQRFIHQERANESLKANYENLDRVLEEKYEDIDNLIEKIRWYEWELKHWKAVVRDFEEQA